MRLVLIYAVLAALNAGAWCWAVIGFRGNPALLGVALVVYGLGLRHAIDADHIAAIDNVTRKLMQEGRRPVAVGFFFALGHSTVVIFAAGAVALAATRLGGFGALRSIGGVIGTLVSAVFLLAIAIMNIVIFASIYRSYRHVRAGGRYVEEDLDILLNNRGVLARVFRPMFHLIRRSWHMYPLGFMFGLGFDTATEVAVFGVSAAQAVKGVPVSAILAFPVLFAAGMSLVDTTDGIMMLGAYEWAFIKPMRKIYYNMTITLISVVVALLIGGIETLGLVADRLDLKGAFWTRVGALNDHFNQLGFVIIGIFAAAWLISYLIYKAKRLDAVDVRLLVGATIVLASVAAALRPSRLSAADLGGRAPPILAASSPWEGFYAGGLMGDLFAGRSRYRTDPFGGAGAVDVIATDKQFGPAVFGLDLGYNHVLPSGLVIGAEGEFSFPDAAGTSRVLPFAGVGPSQVADEIQIYGSLRGRLGYAFGDNLVYATGGVAYDRDHASSTDGAGDYDTTYFSRPGYALGVGAETLLTAKFSARLEYLFYDFARSGTYFPAAGEHYGSDLSFQTVRLGLDYHFNDATPSVGTSGGVLPESIAKNLSIHAQTTQILQANAPFPAAYSGTNSLYSGYQARDTVSVTGFLGFKDPYEGTEFYYNPEPFQGYGLSNTHGLAGFPNIEAQKAGYNFPHYNTARLFLRHVWGFGGEQEDIEDTADQVAEKVDVKRLTLTFGKYAIGDIFDANTYSHDGRTGFMNWALVDAGAFNYSADQQGYTYGATLDLNQPGWAARAGYFLVPDVSNGENFDTRIGRRGQAIVELQRPFDAFGKPGILRLLAFETQFYAGSYAATLNNPVLIDPLTDGGSPDIAATRKTRSQYGFVGNVEWAATKDLGLFARISWWNGQSEIIYTDIDESFSAGVVLAGTSWGRPLDRIGLAGVVSGISGNFQKFLSIGGLGVNIGDGALTYRPEETIEAYYAYSLSPNLSLTADYQYFTDPGYNAARGPVNVGSARLHFAY